jgi:hypothetical protein
MSRPVAVFDAEVYKDYFLCMFRNLKTGKTTIVEQYEGHPFDDGIVTRILGMYTLVTFNGINFDMPILGAARAGADNLRLKEICNAIIDEGLKPWDIERRYGIQIPACDHIDLIDVAPGIASLKIYGGRMHCRRMQDLPIKPTASISVEDRQQLIEYCSNDLDTTAALYATLQPQLELRARMSEQYEQDLRSKSDAAIAEAVLKSEIAKELGTGIERPTIAPGTSYKYRPPIYIGYNHPALQAALETVVHAEYLISDAGKVIIPKEVQDLKIKIGASVYRMGIGGLHSTESSVAHIADDNYILVDRDVASYYPAIILQGHYPKHLGEAFLAVYRTIVERRLQAKAAGDKATADSLKIVVNASFGKLGSKWSALYSPDLMIAVTMTGQLALLMLIEWLEDAGIPVVSANTDGVVIKCPRGQQTDMEAIVFAWEICAGFMTEASYYAALYSRDVNNYIALKQGGGYKAKGVFTPAGLQKNPTTTVCVEAVINKLIHGTPIAATITDCRDITKFVTIRTVRGGAHKDGLFLGKAVRWYYATGVEGAIQYLVNGYTVPRTEGAKPLMELPVEFPGDVDYGWYVREANLIMVGIGA